MFISNLLNYEDFLAPKNM